MNELCFPKLFDNNQKITIPIIQRDYAHGRDDKKATDVRDNFIHDLKKAISHTDLKPMILDFIYGYSEDNKFIPFDGQQRLTTLYLLYLYAAAREGRLRSPEMANILANFRYEVRESASAFQTALLNHLVAHAEMVAALLNERLADQANAKSFSDHIRDQSWFSPEWRHDPTITGMLVMLDALQREFADAGEFADRLLDTENSPVRFYFRDIRELNSSAEDLFIKMNARGKELTPFENFKALFLKWLKNNNSEEVAATFARKFDKDWLQLFWNTFAADYADDKAVRVDAHFYNFLVWMADVFLAASAEKGWSPQKSEEADLYKLLTEALSAKPLVAEGNLAFLEASLDWLATLDATGGVGAFLESVFHCAENEIYPVAGRISWFRSIAFFRDCCDIKGPGYAQGEEFLAILLGRPENSGRELSSATMEALRILRNIVDNSEFELRPDNYPRQLRGIVNLVRDGRLDLASGFNTAQLDEEAAKIVYRQKGLDVQNLEWLEDHPLLRGCVIIFADEVSEDSEDRRKNILFTERSLRNGRILFSLGFGADGIPQLDKTQMLRALLSCGDFFLEDGSFIRIYWDYTARGRTIFVAPNNNNFDGIHSACRTLADKISHCGAQDEFKMELDNIITEYLKDKKNNRRLDWIWYLVRHPSSLPFELGTNGRYLFPVWDHPFIIWQMQKEMRHGAYWNPFLWAAWVEADLPEKESQYKFEDCQGKENERPIYFFRLKLYLWPWEFGWRIWSIDGKNLRDSQRKRLDAVCAELRTQNIIVNEEGWCEVDGVAMAGDEWKPREYDKADRVEIGKKIILALAHLQDTLFHSTNED